mmetsp:Transcript_10325/g.35641  ORF Transcript_10325/g.35641 Transcript_10325/m.35641 type:complete len:286 (-) Transcript_10325:106-963(-)
MKQKNHPPRPPSPIDKAGEETRGGCSGGRLHRLEALRKLRDVGGGVVHVGRRHVNALVDQRGDALVGLDVLQHRDDLLEQSGLLRRADLLRHGVVGLDVHWVGLGRVDPLGALLHHGLLDGVHKPHHLGHGSLEALGLDILEELLDLLQVLLPRLLKRLDVLPVRILCVHRAHTLHHTVDPLVRFGDHLGGDVLNFGYDGHAVGLDGTLERLDPGAKGCRGLLLHQIVILGRQVGGEGSILEQKPQTLQLLALHGLAGVRRHGSLGWRPPWGLTGKSRCEGARGV